jgi:hypothetical protein
LPAIDLQYSGVPGWTAAAEPKYWIYVYFDKAHNSRLSLTLVLMASTLGA